MKGIPPPPAAQTDEALQEAITAADRLVRVRIDVNFAGKVFSFIVFSYWLKIVPKPAQLWNSLHDNRSFVRLQGEESGYGVYSFRLMIIAFFHVFYTFFCPVEAK
jgi:hypothetical protein